MSRPAITISVWAVITFILFIIYFGLEPYLNISNIPKATIFSLIAITAASIAGLIGFLLYGETKKSKDATNKENNLLLSIESQNEKLISSQDVQVKQGKAIGEQHEKYVNKVEALHKTINERYEQEFTIRETVVSLSGQVKKFSSLLSERDGAIDDKINEVKKIAVEGKEIADKTKSKLSTIDQWIKDHMEHHKNKL